MKTRQHRLRDLAGRVGDSAWRHNALREAAWELTAEDPAAFEMAGRFLAAGALESLAFLLIPTGFHLSGLRHDVSDGWFAVLGGPALVSSNRQDSPTSAIIEASLLAASGVAAMRV